MEKKRTRPSAVYKEGLACGRFDAREDLYLHLLSRRETMRQIEQSPKSSELIRGSAQGQIRYLNQQLERIRKAREREVNSRPRKEVKE